MGLWTAVRGLAVACGSVAGGIQEPVRRPFDTVGVTLSACGLLLLLSFGSVESSDVGCIRRSWPCRRRLLSAGKHAPSANHRADRGLGARSPCPSRSLSVTLSVHAYGAGTAPATSAYLGYFCHLIAARRLADT